MKTFKNHLQQTALAVLSSQKSNTSELAVLSFAGGEITRDISGAHNRVQILPDGYFKPTDNRTIDTPNGQWLMDEQAFGDIQALAERRTNDFHFDYEHQTLNSDENGKPAPAAGWFKKLDYVPGEGLFAVDVDWTVPAAQFIKNKEYRYTSAVFTYDKSTGRPLQLLHVALTNDPALDGMKAITSLKASLKAALTKNTNHSTTPTGETPMNEALTLMLGLLGIAHTDDDLSNTAALTAIQDKAKTAIAALKTKADKADSQTEEIAALKAKNDKADGAVDLTKFVPKDVYDAAITQVAALKAGSDKNSIEQLLKDNKDKVFASEQDYLTSFGEQQGFAALKTMLNARPAIAALKTTQTQDKKAPSDNVAALTVEQKYTADQLGISHKDYLTQLNKETK